MKKTKTMLLAAGCFSLAISAQAEVVTNFYADFTGSEAGQGAVTASILNTGTPVGSWAENTVGSASRATNGWARFDTQSNGYDYTAALGSSTDASENAVTLSYDVRNIRSAANPGNKASLMLVRDTNNDVVVDLRISTSSGTTYLDYNTSNGYTTLSSALLDNYGNTNLTPPDEWDSIKVDMGDSGVDVFVNNAQVGSNLAYFGALNEDISNLSLQGTGSAQSGTWYDNICLTQSNSLSMGRIDLMLLNSGDLEIRWEAEAISAYTLQSKFELNSGSWSNAIPGIAGIDGTLAVTTTPTAAHSFYRTILFSLALDNYLSAVSRYLNDPVVNKYCFINNSFETKSQLAKWIPSESLYRWYDIGEWNGSSWTGARILEATNLATFTQTPLTMGSGGWGTQKFWEETWLEKDGTYAIYWSAWEGDPAGDASSRIGVATSTSKYGPFSAAAQPMDFGPYYSGIHAINPFAFIDPDTGEAYLYWSMKDPALTWDGQEGSCIYAAQLDSTLIHIVGSPVLIAEPDRDWEKGGAGGATRRWNESAIVFKEGATYYLAYSARNFNGRDYCTGYATSTNALGPFVEYDDNPFASGEPHHASGIWSKVGMKTIVPTVDSKELWAVYNVGNPKYDADTPQEWQDLINGPRGIDRVVIRSDGTLAFNGPNFYWQARPSGTIAGGNIFPGGTVTTSGNASPIDFLRDGEIGIDSRFSQYDWVSSQPAQDAWINRYYITPKRLGVIMLYKSADSSRYFSDVTVIIEQDDGTVTTRVIKMPDPILAGAPGIVSFNPELEQVRNVRFDNFVPGESSTELGLSEIRIMGEN